MLRSARGACVCFLLSGLWVDGAAKRLWPLFTYMLAGLFTGFGRPGRYPSVARGQWFTSSGEEKNTEEDETRTSGVAASQILGCDSDSLSRNRVSVPLCSCHRSQLCQRVRRRPDRPKTGRVRACSEMDQIKLARKVPWSCQEAQTPHKCFAYLTAIAPHVSPEQLWAAIPGCSEAYGSKGPFTVF